MSTCWLRSPARTAFELGHGEGVGDVGTVEGDGEDHADHVAVGIDEGRAGVAGLEVGGEDQHLAGDLVAVVDVGAGGLGHLADRERRRPQAVRPAGARRRRPRRPRRSCRGRAPAGRGRAPGARRGRGSGRRPPPRRAPRSRRCAPRSSRPRRRPRGRWSPPARRRRRSRSPPGCGRRPRPRPSRSTGPPRRRRAAGCSSTSAAARRRASSRAPRRPAGTGPRRPGAAACRCVSGGSGKRSSTNSGDRRGPRLAGRPAGDVGHQRHEHPDADQHAHDARHDPGGPVGRADARARQRGVEPRARRAARRPVR